MNLEDIRKQVICCQKCKLWQTAKCAVPGEGTCNPKVVLVGQNPGTEEDKVGKPFVGRAGKFLNKVLAENGLDRSQLFVTNIVKHLTPQNRVPLSNEIAACKPYLTKQIDLVKPKVVVLMGKIAWQTPRTEDVVYLETVHPSAAMRFKKMRLRFEQDFADLARRF